MERQIPLSPEKRALLCCARVNLDGSSREELTALVRGGLDFHALMQDARYHGIMPLLSRHMSAIAVADTCPAELLVALRRSVQSNALTSFALAAELVAVLKLFRAANIEAIAVKGPVSAALCYGDLGLRTFSDLDILIAPDDVGTATELLEARGYAPQLKLPPGWQNQLVREGTERLFRHPDGVRMVDLHWHLMRHGYSFTPGTRGVFARRQTVYVGTHKVPTLALEPTLLFLLLHGMKHDWSSLGWLTDVAELLRRHPTLDWELLLEWSSPRGPRRFIDVGLSLAHALLDAPVASSVLRRGTSDPAVAHTVERLKAQLLTPPSAGTQSLFDRTLGITYFRAMQCPGDRMRFVHDVVFRPTQHEWRAVPLPTGLAPLHYLVRPLRLLWKHAGSRHL